MLDVDLAYPYGVTTGNLNKAVKRNINRFPDDFMFQLNSKEYESLKFQFGISEKTGRGGRRYLPHAFTEHGVLMLSNVLNSDKPAQVNIQIMRTFAKLRQLILHKDVKRKIESMERKYDAQFKVVFDAIKQLMLTPQKPKRRIGF